MLYRPKNRNIVHVYRSIFQRFNSKKAVTLHPVRLIQFP